MTYRKFVPQSNVIDLLDDIANGTVTQLDQGTLTRAAATASGDSVVTVGFNPSYILFYGVDDANDRVFSDGIDNGIISCCTRGESFSNSPVIHSKLTKIHNHSIHIETSSEDGHSAVVSSKSSTGFTITWTKIGDGRNITIKYLAVK